MRRDEAMTRDTKGDAVGPAGGLVTNSEGRGLVQQQQVVDGVVILGECRRLEDGKSICFALTVTRSGADDNGDDRQRASAAVKCPHHKQPARRRVCFLSFHRPSINHSANLRRNLSTNAVYRLHCHRQLWGTAPRAAPLVDFQRFISFHFGTVYRV